MFVATRWDCPNCAAKDLDAEKCPFCGTSRDGGAAAPSQFIAGPVSAPAQPARATTGMLPPNLFILNRKNTAFVHGKSSHVGDRYIAYLIISTLVTVVAGVLIFLYLADQWGTLWQLNQSGVAARATVISRRYVRGSKSSTYYVTYQFYVKDTPYAREQTVNRGTYDRFPEQSKVTVRYLANDPKTSLLSGDSEDNSSMYGMSAVFGIMMLVLVGFTYYNANKTRFYRRLNRSGTLLEGQLTSTNRSRSKNGWRITVGYSFTTPDGQVLQKSATEYRNDLGKGPLPRYGTPVAVLYVDDRHFELM